MTLSYSHAGVSECGPVRQENQDRWFADAEQGLYVVSDGMGGHAVGALAAQVVVETLPPLLAQRLPGDGRLTQPTAEQVANALIELSNRLFEQSHDEPDLDGMGATVVLAVVDDERALVVHLGDSRAYLWRKERLEQLTRDHSLVQLLIDNDEIRPEEAAEHPARGQVTQYVGMEGGPVPAFRLIELHDGDRLLLCSDGLHGMLSDEAMASILAGCETPQQGCQRLLESAVAAGGRDNITVLLVEARQQAETSSAG